MDVLSAFKCSADHAQGGAIIHRGERAGIAVMQDCRAVIDQRGPMRAHSTVDGDIVVGYLLSRLQQDRAKIIWIAELAAVGDCQEFVHRPSQIDRGRSRGFELVAMKAQVAD